MEVFKNMIRMGRSSKTEPSDENSRQPERSAPANAAQAYPSGSVSSAGLSNANRGVVSESESMARDIKEGRLSGFVGHGTVLTGETNFQAMLRIDGHLTGRVTSESGTLIVGSTGQVDANIIVATANINGTVNGDIIATEKLELGRSAHIVGNVQSPRLVIADGAILEGSCSMIKARESFEKRYAEANAPRVVEENAHYQLSETNETNQLSEYSDDEAEEGSAAAANN